MDRLSQSEVQRRYRERQKLKEDYANIRKKESERKRLFRKRLKEGTKKRKKEDRNERI